MPRIGLDARMIHHSGIGSYLQGLLTNLPKVAPGENLVLFGSPGDLASFSYEKRVFASPIYSLTEQWSGAWTFAKARLDLLHVPHYNIPLAYNGKLVVTIHDIIHLLFPRFARRRGAVVYAGFFIKRALRKARRIVTVSQRTAEDLRSLGASPEKLRVIPPGIHPEFKPVPLEKARGVLSRHHLKPGFILFVGDVRPHKNVGGLIKAHWELKRSWKDCPDLVIVGKTERLNGSLGLDPRLVHLIGRLERTEDLARIYSSAGVLAFPSFYEGFGLPPLEAMACGCPVVTSREGGLPEAVGEAAVFVDPKDLRSLAQALREVLQNPALKGRLVEEGLKRSKKYTWEEAAKKTWAVYEEALSL